MSQDETRAATMAKGREMFGGIHAEPNAEIRRTTGNPFARTPKVRKPAKTLNDIFIQKGSPLAIKKQPSAAHKFGQFLGSSLRSNVDAANALDSKVGSILMNNIDNPSFDADFDPEPKDVPNTFPLRDFFNESPYRTVDGVRLDANGQNMDAQDYQHSSAISMKPDLRETPKVGLGVDSVASQATLGVPSHIGPQGAVQSPVTGEVNSRRITTPQGYIERSGEGNLNGMSGQEVLNRLVKRRNGALESEVGASNRNPFKPQETVHNPNGIPASGAVDYLHTPQGTGQYDAYGREIKKTPRSVQLESALDFNYNKNDKKAKKYDDAIKSGLSPQEAYADVINSSRSFKDREIRLQERAQTEKHAIDTRASDVADKAQITNELTAEANAGLASAQALGQTALSHYYKSYGDHLKGQNSTSEKNALNNAYFEAFKEVNAMMEGPDKEIALKRLQAMKNGQTLEVVSPHKDATSSFLGFGGSPEVQAVTRVINNQ